MAFCLPHSDLGIMECNSPLHGKLITIGVLLNSILACDNDMVGKAFSPSSLLLSVNGVNVICAHGRAQMSSDKTFFSICEIFGLRKDSWVVDYFRLSWNLFVDLWIKPGFEIAFSIWQTFKSDLPMRYWFWIFFRICTILFFRLSLFGFRNKLFIAFRLHAISVWMKTLIFLI